MSFPQRIGFFTKMQQNKYVIDFNVYFVSYSDLIGSACMKYFVSALLEFLFILTFHWISFLLIYQSTSLIILNNFELLKIPTYLWY